MTEQEDRARWEGTMNEALSSLRRRLDKVEGRLNGLLGGFVSFLMVIAGLYAKSLGLW